MITRRRYAMPTWICFDVGCTLVDPDPVRLVGAWGPPGQRPADDLSIVAAFRKACDARFFIEPDGSGSSGLAAFWAFLLHAEPIEGERAVAQLFDGRLLYTEVDDDAAELLGFLRRQGITTCVVTNNNGSPLPAAEMLDRRGLGEYVDFVVESRVDGVEKPDFRIYERAAQTCALPLEQGWFVGDSVFSDYVGPLAAGFDRAYILDKFNAWPLFPAEVRLRALRELSIIVGEARAELS